MSDTPSGGPRVGDLYLTEARGRLAACHEKIQHCLGQLIDEQVWWRPLDSMNSIANIVLHLCGNLRQWLVAGVGGAADERDRPAEFAERGPIPRDEPLRRLAAVVAEADAVLAGADEFRLLEPRRIQGFDGTVLSAIFDSLTHLSGHTQEIVYITRLQLGAAYRFAWTPTTPEQGVSQADGETVAVRDATFEELPAHPLPPPTPVEAPAAPVPPLPAAPLDDYLIQLEQEFQDEQEEGKL